MQLTPDNYYALETDRAFMSVSQFNGWIACPSKEKARLDGRYEPPDKRAFIVGNYVDCAITTPELFDAYKREHAEGLFCDPTLAEIRSLLGGETD